MIVDFDPLGVDASSDKMVVLDLCMHRSNEGMCYLQL